MNIQCFWHWSILDFSNHITQPNNHKKSLVKKQDHFYQGFARNIKSIYDNYFVKNSIIKNYLRFY